VSKAKGGKAWTNPRTAHINDDMEVIWKLRTEKDILLAIETELAEIRDMLEEWHRWKK